MLNDCNNEKEESCVKRNLLHLKAEGNLVIAVD